MEKDNRNHYIQIRLNDEEKQALEQKFSVSQCKSKSRFIRLMILEGVIVHFDEEKMRKMMYDFGTVANNVNQIARRVNSTGNIYAEDVQQIEREVQEIWQQLRYFQSLLQKLKP